MLAAPWVCRQCARAVLLRRVGFQRRHASTTGTVPPVLLERARCFAAEHAQLKEVLATQYEAKAAKRIGEIQGVAQALAAWEEAQRAADELRAMATTSSSSSSSSSSTSAANDDSDAELRQLARDELVATEATLAELAEQLSVSLTPTHPFAHMPCLLELRPGPGGLEGRFFTDSLFRMYQSYCTRQGFRARVIKYDVSDSAGETGSDGESALQEAVLEVQDAGAYDVFRGEAGIHRVQRVPATERSGRTHTSAAAVWVLPSFEEDAAASGSSTDVDNPDSDFYIHPSDVRVETMRARGAGGQHVNKTESAIRLTHTPTGTVVSMQDSRSQHQNRDNAWKILRARIAQRRREQREEDARQLRASVLAPSQVTRSDKIRTYNYSQDRVSDHRCGLDVHNLPDVLAGGATLARVMAAVAAWQREKAVEAVMAEEAAEAAAAGGGRSKAAAGKK